MSKLFLAGLLSCPHFPHSALLFPALGSQLLCTFTVRNQPSCDSHFCLSHLQCSYDLVLLLFTMGPIPTIHLPSLPLILAALQDGFSSRGCYSVQQHPSAFRQHKLHKHSQCPRKRYPRLIFLAI